MCQHRAMLKNRYAEAVILLVIWGALVAVTVGAYQNLDNEIYAVFTAWVGGVVSVLLVQATLRGRRTVEP